LKGSGVSQEGLKSATRVWSQPTKSGVSQEGLNEAQFILQALEESEVIQLFFKVFKNPPQSPSLATSLQHKSHDRIPFHMMHTMLDDENNHRGKNKHCERENLEHLTLSVPSAA
jgi:hypothetical protein